MDDIKINPIKKFEGAVSLRGDKSISHRSVMIASIAEGQSRIKNFLRSEDALYTIKAFKQLGVAIGLSNDDIIVEGKGLDGLKGPKGDIYLGNSGTSMRLLSGVLAGQNFKSTLTGDESLSRRPMYRIIRPLRQMGAHIKGREDNFPPLVIEGAKLRAIRYKTEVASAQIKSALIFAALYADGVTEIEEPIKSRDHTERMLGLFGAKMEIDDLRISVNPRPDLKGRSLAIPGDISSAAFFIIGALILKGSEILIKDLLFNRTRWGIIEILNQMGAEIKIENKRFNGCEEICDINVRSSRLKGITVDENRIPSVIDELPILMVAACFAEGDTYIKGAGELRIKETDRIASMSAALESMGADISVERDNILIKPTARLRGAVMDSRGDHRTAMSLAIAALCAKGSSRIKKIDCVNTSFPDFFQALDAISLKK
ncbi:MAG: 3-phosphoshikimate 1-carboxyvinyltransferase [Candidatus Omnitrophica bacterium]|nr:3-phosphoshikimate 1-carboxyvinyltransferase [Candidatus Omnitrophota bacterium]